MDVVLWLGRSYLVPGSPMFLVMGVLAALVLLGPERTRALGRRALWALALVYLALSTAFAAGGLAHLLGGTTRLELADVVRDADAIVLIGCGVITAGHSAAPVQLPGIETAWNISETVRLHRLAGGKRIIATGGMPPGGAGKIPESEVMQGFLTAMGVPVGDIVLESQATNTVQQARNVAGLLPRGARVVVVTVPTHMPRTAGFFRAQRLQVIEAVSGVPEADVAPTLATKFIPNRYSLRASERAMYEVLGLTYYWLRGDFRQ
jgi:uncharacterized SAM-binding protein YcdF (DUF218 family)